ncbi:metal ABC transporter substrate-binding protein [Goekera deserti]|uniref:metal ABC transporter substrate-binding protein n=1 Tax=Goekera deserti TaxID=2497753 RepID=UPI0015752E08|nr:metal ABC transporter substrate-binding protein [Goekera deserti]
MSGRGRASALACAGVLALAGCGAANGSGSDTADGGLTIAASFYPLQWLGEQIAGTHGTVTSLTPPGVEPHEYELTPGEVAATAEADIVVYLSAYQPSVDAAVDEQAGDRAFDAAGPADLDLLYQDGHAEEHADGTHAEGVRDPHFWHDPMRMADVGDALAEALSRADEAHRADYTANAADLREQLTALNGEFRDGLARCASRDVVTGHSAFGYLADAYGLRQFGISGLAPDEEPSPGALTGATDFIREHGVRAVYAETLVSPAVAETVARETGAQVLILDPIEGLTDASQGTDYLELMHANLADLRTGQQCS